jgi:hypothetical protein
VHGKRRKLKISNDNMCKGQLECSSFRLLCVNLLQNRLHKLNGRPILFTSPLTLWKILIVHAET